MVDCKDSLDLLADLENPQCRAAVLSHLSGQVGVESIVLSHHREKQYGRAAVAVLYRILELARAIERLSGREPTPNFPGRSRREVSARCAACRFNPRSLFPGLREALLRDFSEFHGRFADTAGRLHAYRERGCRACTAVTRDDMIFLFREWVAFGERALGLGGDGRGTA